MSHYCGKMKRGAYASTEDCPICLEKFDIDDKTFYPCTCGYQICRFCWHRIRSEASEDSSGSCPACRKKFTEDPAYYEPQTVEEVKQLIRAQKVEAETLKKQNEQLLKQGEILERQKIFQSRKRLTELRVIQKNLVFILGIQPELANKALLKSNAYFGQFGKIYSIVLVPNPNAEVHTGDLSCGAFITFRRPEDALRAIQSINDVLFGFQPMKASFGTAKYCSYYTRNQVCRKTDCTFLHYQGDPEASFTKKDMKVGKHQLYEKKLIEEFKKNCVA